MYGFAFAVVIIPKNTRIKGLDCKMFFICFTLSGVRYLYVYIISYIAQNINVLFFG